MRVGRYFALGLPCAAFSSLSFIYVLIVLKHTQFDMSLLFGELIHTQQEVKLFGPAFSGSCIFISEHATDDNRVDLHTHWHCYRWSVKYWYTCFQPHSGPPAPVRQTTYVSFRIGGPLTYAQNAYLPAEFLHFRR